jgi:hypothetical protein
MSRFVNHFLPRPLCVGFLVPERRETYRIGLANQVLQINDVDSLAFRMPKTLPVHLFTSKADITTRLAVMS